MEPAMLPASPHPLLQPTSSPPPHLPVNLPPVSITVVVMDGGDFSQRESLPEIASGGLDQQKAKPLNQLQSGQSRKAATNRCI